MCVSVLSVRACMHMCVGHPGGRKVEVRYVDFGNENTVSVSDLRKIKDEFFALPTMVRTDQLIFIFSFNNKKTTYFASAVSWPQSIISEFVLFESPQGLLPIFFLIMSGYIMWGVCMRPITNPCFFLCDHMLVP